jgi:HPt (histidine-containing phosphotransfer) domain-containing protein
MPTNPQQPRVLDTQVVDNLRMLQEPGDPDFAIEIVQLFLSDSAARLAVVHETVARGDLPALAEIAHMVKGSAGLIGAECMVEAALRLEQAARQGGPAAIHVADLADGLGHAFDAVRAAFAQLGITESGAQDPQGS